MTAAALRALTANHGTLATSEVRFETADGTPLTFTEARVEAVYDRDEFGDRKLNPETGEPSLVRGTVPTLVIVLR